MNLKKLLIIFAGCLCMSSCGAYVADGKSNRMVKLCHVPFDAATSAPMTPSNFSRSCADIGELSIDDERYLTIWSAINKSEPGPFLNGGIRVRMINPDGSYIYIDDAGGVAIRSQYFKLDQASFLRVKRIIKRLAKEKGIIGVE